MREETPSAAGLYIFHQLITDHLILYRSLVQTDDGGVPLSSSRAGPDAGRCLETPPRAKSNADNEAICRCRQGAGASLIETPQKGTGDDQPWINQ